MNEHISKIQQELENKMLAIQANTFVKPFDKVYESARDKKKVFRIYSEGEESIYKKVITQFLAENPDFLEAA